MNTVLVTGAGGFIGSYAAALFALRGWNTYGTFHRRRPGAGERPADVLAGLEKTTFLRTDITVPASLRATVREAAAGGKLDAIVHCAGRATDTGRTARFRRTNLDPVRVLVELAHEFDVGRLVFVSTTDVYGLRDFDGQDEDALPLSPFPPNPYPAFKIEAEKAVRSGLEPDRYSILRPAQVWGVGDLTLTSRVASFLRSSPFIVHFGPWRGANRWPLAHVRNVAKACFLAATVRAAAGRAINVVDLERTSIDEFTHMVADVFLAGKRFKTVCLPMWAGVGLGRMVSALSNAFDADRPFMDPSHYAVYSVSRNLDFSGKRFADMMADAGERSFTREEALVELRSHTGSPRPPIPSRGP
ncbi:MAG: NAD-dependent epimerase/dehydratase family protein [Lentisphaerae bacterium]|nr:NAD-dependent epimerase/dehydratase family protein [Lentisphaerota bacterium]